jgi:hypothetical protein
MHANTCRLIGMRIKNRQRQRVVFNSVFPYNLSDYRKCYHSHIWTFQYLNFNMRIPVHVFIFSLLTYKI